MKKKIKMKNQEDVIRNAKKEDLDPVALIVAQGEKSFEQTSKYIYKFNDFCLTNNSKNITLHIRYLLCYTFTNTFFVFC